MINPILAQTDVDLDSLGDALADNGVSGWDWLWAGAILAIALLVSRAAKALVKRVSGRATDAFIADLLGRLVAYAFVTMGLLYALDVLGVRIGPLLGALGILGIAVAFALRDILENFVAGLMLNFRRPFSYGDQIVSGENEGTVTAIDFRTVTIETPDGETVEIPSSQVLTEPIVNLTARGARRTTLPLGIAYGTDIDEARAVLVNAVSTAVGVRPDPPPEVLLTGFGDSSVDFVLRFWHEPSIAGHWRTRSEVGFVVDAACRRHGIDIPFPQQVIRWAGPSTSAG